MSAGEGGIFDAHLLVLEDRTLLDEVIRNIQENQVNAEYAFHIVAEKYASALAAIEDDYLRERATDMRDVTSRILNNLMGRKEEVDLKKLTEPCIIISYDLSPSTTAQMDRKTVLGFATDMGGKTSHTAIMARSLRIPAVVGLKSASNELETGQYALLDGFNGVIIINPSDQTLFEYGQIIRKQVSLEEKLRDIQAKPAVTLDGQRITLSANVEQSADSEQVKICGAEGRRPFSHGIPVHQPHQSPHRGGAIPGLSRGGRRAETAAGHHPHARSRRRQVHDPSRCAAGDESLPRLARHPLLPSGKRRFPRPAPRHPPRQRRTATSR